MASSFRKNSSPLKNGSTSFALLDSIFLIMPPKNSSGA
jgi:hypothetical protein